MKKIILLLLLIASLFILSCSNDAKVEETTMTKTAMFDTNHGTFKIKLADDMPITAGNFVKLAESGFYDGTRFHRIIGPSKAPPNGFMIQGGDPLSKDLSKKSLWGTGDPGYKIKDEFTSNNRNSVGTISMANAGPNTGGSQFFINLNDNSFLDDKHPVFGKVVEGMHIVKKIGNVDTNNRDQPLEDVIVNKVTIE